MSIPSLEAGSWSSGFTSLPRKSRVSAFREASEVPATAVRGNREIPIAAIRTKRPPNLAFMSTPPYFTKDRRQPGQFVSCAYGTKLPRNSQAHPPLRRPCRNARTGNVRWYISTRHGRRRRQGFKESLYRRTCPNLALAEDQEQGFPAQRTGGVSPEQMLRVLIIPRHHRQSADGGEQTRFHSFHVVAP